jgi:hypothetical protein
LNLATDECGNVLQSVAVVYPRLGRHEDESLSIEERARIVGRVQSVQRERHTSYREYRLRAGIDEHLNRSHVAIVVTLTTAFLPPTAQAIFRRRAGRPRRQPSTLDRWHRGRTTRRSAAVQRASQGRHDSNQCSAASKSTAPSSCSVTVSAGRWPLVSLPRTRRSLASLFRRHTSVTGCRARASIYLASLKQVPDPEQGL